LFCAVVNEQCAFHELATVKASECYFAAKIELISLKPFAVYDALFRWPFGAHFPFAVPPVAYGLSHFAFGDFQAFG
jgi:hypothetical protein